ncbi:uncharacterized protein LOC133888801 isoform X3 [Phragmites australis]|uniref:uncharacterized protein LOC133888801 isoform X3 n=1 Tax=Phragmites australis TaxID=29695 RepID=UPI002D76F4EA|nr:uncharacterized protein LOC133888801 isoform X3 [Phragmites australis]
MGKNQAYKAMQRSRLGSSSGAPGATDAPEDGMTDGSFHSPEWHAARLASLSKTHTVTWEEFKKKQKEEELKRGEVEADKDKMMREYRAQLDAERAQKLGLGRNHSRSKSKSSSSKRDRKDKDAKKRSKKRRKWRDWLDAAMADGTGMVGTRYSTRSNLVVLLVASSGKGRTSTHMKFIRFKFELIIRIIKQ